MDNVRVWGNSGAERIAAIGEGANTLNMCRLWGHGPKNILAIGGWLSDSHVYDQFLANLSPDEFTVLLPDFRGYGASRDRSGHYTLDEIAQDAVAAAGSLGWRAYDVLGHSMGGGVALKVAHLAGQAVRRIVLICPVPPSGVPFDEETLGFFKAAVSSQDVRQQHFAFLTSGRTTRAWQAQMAAHSWATSKEAAFGAYLDAWRLADFADEVATLPHPKLAIIIKRQRRGRDQMGLRTR